MFSKALLVLSLLSVAFATVYVTNPVASTTDTGGRIAEVTWQDDGNPPTLAQFGPAMISIYAGNAQQQTSLQLINGSVNVATTSSVNFTVNPNIGPNSNRYFIRFQSLSGTDTKGTPYEAFSSQFTLANMTGTFSASVLAEIAGQSTAPLGGATTSSSLSTPASTPSLPTNTPATSASSTPSASVRPSNDAMGLKAGWAGLVFGAIIGVMMF